MFGSLFCLLVLSVLSSSLIELPIASPFFTPVERIWVGSLAYLLILSSFFFLGRLCSSWEKSRASLFAQALLLLFFLAEKLVLGWPVELSHFLSAATLFGLYFLALWVFHIGYEWTGNKGTKPFDTIRLLLPFTIPYFSLLLLSDVWKAFPFPDWVFGLASAAVLLLGVLFIPVFLQKSWGCLPMPHSPLSVRLERVCQECGFRHGGLKVWTPMRDVYTAAIIGILPRFRYILFTESLLTSFPPEELEAILIHEIGHSQKKHMLFYPIILVGMVFSLILPSLFFTQSFYAVFFLEELIHPGYGWQTAFPIVFFGGTVLLLGLYFRFVFGFFSRNFERQADLHIFSTNANPQAMRESLDRLGVMTGYTHGDPSWHHDSIENRIAFLKKAEGDSRLVKRHHWKVQSFVFSYFAAVLAGITLVLASTTSLFQPVGAWIDRSSEWLAREITPSLRVRAVERVVQEYDLPLHRETIEAIIDHTIDFPSSFDMRGTFILTLAQVLADQGANDAAGTVVTKLNNTYHRLSSTNQQGLAELEESLKKE